MRSVKSLGKGWMAATTGLVVLTVIFMQALGLAISTLGSDRGNLSISRD